MTKIEGGCRCGAVRYEAAGAVLNTMICHCRSCRGAAAAPVVAWITVPAEGFRYTRGKPNEYRSSAPVTRSFCGACGTPLAYVHSGRPEHIDVTTCSLDAPERHPPTHHSWLAHDLSWVRFGDGLPAYEEFKP